MSTTPRARARIPAWLLAALLAASVFTAQAGDNPAFWKHRVKGDFATILNQVKNGLIDAQFQITSEENLSRGLENNRHLFPPGKWNTIGFDNVTAVHFCSIVFNQEVFNVNLEWAILCPFKFVAYTTKKSPEDVTLVMVRPTYLLKEDGHKQAGDVGRRIEARILQAIEDGLALPR